MGTSKSISIKYYRYSESGHSSLLNSIDIRCIAMIQRQGSSLLGFGYKIAKMKSWEKEEFEKCANCILVATCDSGLVPEDVVFTLQILKAITLEISS